jgi:hypothetical protein
VSTRRRHGAGGAALAGSAFVLLGVMESLLRIVPFKRLMPMVGLSPIAPGELASDASSGEPASAVLLPADPSTWSTVERVSWGVEAASRRTPWTSKCLSQSLAGAVLLRVRRRPATIYFGARPANRSTGGPMTAHAWLVSENQILTGAAGHAEYAVVGVFRSA